MLDRLLSPEIRDRVRWALASVSVAEVLLRGPGRYGRPRWIEALLPLLFARETERLSARYYAGGPR